MLASFALVLLVGLAMAEGARRLKLPRIIGLLAAGILLGPYALNWLESESGRLNLPDKICSGQGYRGKTGMLGVGNCTCECTHSVGGCPPTAGAICEFLSAQMK